MEARHYTLISIKLTNSKFMSFSRKKQVTCHFLLPDVEDIGAEGVIEIGAEQAVIVPETVAISLVCVGYVIIRRTKSVK